MFDTTPVGSERILFVDDEESLASACVEMLQMQGYTVSKTTSSREALRLIQEHPAEYDLLVTDQTMPEMTGTELAAEVRKIRLEMLIILCSGNYFNKFGQEAEKLAVQALCMKPLEMDSLARTVRQVLDTPGGLTAEVLR